MLAVLGALAATACDDDVRLAGPSGGSGGAGSPSAGTAEPAEPALTAGAGGSPDTGAGGTSVGEATADTLETDLLASSALEVLTRRCGECHGGGQNAGGVGALDDLDALISSGLIVPGNAAASRLLDSIRSGRMPPPSQPQFTPLDVGELWLLEGFIDGMGTDPESCEPAAFLGIDETYAALLADIAAQPEPDRPFIRYVSLTDTPGGCAMPIQRLREAVFTTVNGTSLDPEIHLPVPIDAAELLYRLDIRDYDWDRWLDLDADGNADHPDGWQAIVAHAGAYAVELQGPEADALRAATDTVVPVLPGSVLVWAANSGDVYYTLVGAPANIYETPLGLGVEHLPDPGRLARRAGFWRDNDEFLATRYAREASDRGYWRLSPQPTDDAGSIYEDPLDRGSGGKSLFHLPNGLLAYSLEDYAGARLAGPPACEPFSCTDLSALYPVGGSPAGCQACHHRGLGPVRDQTLALVERNARIIGFSPSELDDIRLLFSAPDLDALLAADNTTYLDALARTGVSPLVRSPLSRVFLSFEREPLDLSRAAAELGVVPAALRDYLPRLPSGFAPLAVPGGTISRAVMTEGLSAVRCVLSEGARNRPVECSLMTETLRP